MVDEFSAFARMPQPDMAPVDLRTLVEGQMTLFEDDNIKLSLVDDAPTADAGAAYIVLGDAGLLRLAVSNLIQNAVDSLRESRTKTPRVELSIGKQAGPVTLKVRDNGPGYPEMDRKKLLEPYVTHRAKGTGLGLAIVSKIVQDHAGTLELVNGDDGGACAIIHLGFHEDMGADQ